MPTEQPWEAAGRPGAHDPHERLEDMDIDKVDAEVLYSSATGGAELYEIDADACLAAFQAFNSAAIEFASVDPDRLIPVYILPLHDIEGALQGGATHRERRRARGAASALSVRLRPRALLGRGLRPAVVRDRGDRHARSASTSAPTSTCSSIMRRDPTPAKGVFQSLPPIFMAEAIARWIVPGVFDRHPRLKVVLVEAGLGWLPYYLTRLDKMSERHGWEQLGMTLQEKPSHYWRQNMFASFEEDEFGIANRHEIGVENLLWATDYPHPDSTWPQSQQVIHDALRRRARRRDASHRRRQRGADLQPLTDESALVWERHWPAQRSILVLAFSGYFDAASAATGARRPSRRAHGATRLAHIDSDRSSTPSRCVRR